MWSHTPGMLQSYISDFDDDIYETSCCDKLCIVDALVLV
jgi:hypothetical protein